MIWRLTGSAQAGCRTRCCIPSTSSRREVDAITPQTLTCLVIGNGSLDLIKEVPHRKVLPIMVNPNIPRAAITAPVYASKATRLIREALRPSSHVFGSIHKLKVAPAIVQSITVDVINLESVRGIKEKAMHLKTWEWRGGCRSRIERIGRLGRNPFMRGNQVLITRVDQGDHPLGQRDADSGIIGVHVKAPTSCATLRAVTAAPGLSCASSIPHPPGRIVAEWR